jgi:hypothetical protein
MTENRFRLIDHEEGLIRCTICDYMPKNLVSLCLRDGNEDRVNSWVEYEVIYGMVSAFGRLMSTERHVKILKMPSSFWNMPRLTFDYFVLIKAQTLPSIARSEPYRMSDYSCARQRARSSISMVS